jgi:ATP-dependent helicase/nuclease subunit B
MGLPKHLVEEDPKVNMSRLVLEIAGLCRSRMLAEKWLIAPSRRVGNQWAECVARSGQATVNLRVKTLKSLATELAGPEMVARKVKLVSEQAGPLLIDQVFRRHRAELRYLGALPASSGLAETMFRSVQDIRLAGLAPDQIVPRKFEVSAKGQDLLRILGGYLDDLKAQGLVDYAGVLQLAVARVQSAPDELGSDIVVVCPSSVRLKPLEKQLLDSLPQDLVCYLPVDEPHKKEDDIGEAGTNLDLLRWLPHPDLAPEKESDGTVEIFRAAGEVNEVREVLRRLLAGQTKLDEAELLYTEAQTYVPLIFETIAAQSACDSVADEAFPATFADGIPTTYSRPGRLLSAWVAWIAEDYPQARLVRMLAEGLLKVPEVEEQGFSFARLASVLRGVGIGLRRDRYLPKLDEKIKLLKQRAEDARSANPDDDPRDAKQHLQSAGRRLAEMEVVWKLVKGLLDVSPEKTADQRAVLDGAKGLLEKCSRTANKTDNFAIQRLTEDIASLRSWLADDKELALNAWDWLAALPANASILGSGPRPGRLHVSSILSGGHSGRGHTFIVGLDDSRFPGAGLQDPLFLDGERRAVSPDLPTATGDLEEKIRDFHRLLARLRGKLALSYSCHDLVDNRDKFPCPLLVAAYRIVSGNREGTQEDFLKWMPAAVSFAPVTEGSCLNTTEWWLWRLCAGDEVCNAERLVEQSFPHLVRGKEATRQRESAEFTEYDGHVPQAGRCLDPTAPNGPVMSSSGLETVGRCPRLFFFKRALGIDLPDELVVEPDRWLDPPAYGELLHSVFEKFVRDLVAAGYLPKYPQDIGKLNAILDVLVARYRDRYPPPTDHAFQTQRSQLQQAAKVFLIEEHRYCAENKGTPVYLESSFGLTRDGHASPLDTPEPVPVKLADGSVIRTCGRVDRIDRIGQGAVETYAVWDYKSGSAWKYDEADPFRQGRVVQPTLYIAMVAHRLRAAPSSKAKVARFGFFFPGTKERGRRIEWDNAQLADGKKVLGQLVDIIRKGAFLATDNKDDCNYCDYQSICGDAAAIAAVSARKLANAGNKALQSIRELRNHVEP